MPEDDETANGGQTIDFVTLGMFIIDEIEYLPPKSPAKDILGGAGSYAALGARLFSPSPDLSRTVGWIVDEGSDFPQPVKELIESWQTSADFRRDDSRLTTRGWNGYVDESETRAFKYTTPKKRLVAADLSTEFLLRARAFHIICSPSRCRELVAELIARRKDETPEGETYCKPLIIWEPVPDRCVPDELLNLTNCLPHVDVCSPNHGELAGFMGDSGLDLETGEISTAAVERSCEQLLGSMPLQNYTLVVRAGEKGCYIAKNGGRKREAEGQKGAKRRRKNLGGGHGTLQPETDMFSFFADMLQDDEGMIARKEIEVDPGVERWIPAYFQKSDKDRVVDPTGGGNTFLGGLAVAMARQKDVEEAATWGSIAAAFAIEQVGVPILGQNDKGEETWNGERVKDRLQEFQTRIGWCAN